MTLKLGDKVRLASTREIEAAAAKTCAVARTHGYNSPGQYIYVPDVKINDIGTLVSPAGDGLFNCRFDRCVVCVDESMVELVHESTVARWTRSLPTVDGIYWHRWYRRYPRWHYQMVSMWLAHSGAPQFRRLVDAAGPEFTASQMLEDNGELWPEPIRPPEEVHP